MTAPFFNARHISERAEALCGALMLEQVRREGHRRAIPATKPAQSRDRSLDPHVMQLRSKGLGDRRIAAILGVPRGHVVQVLRELQ